jgi:mercuric reductase
MSVTELSSLYGSRIDAALATLIRQLPLRHRQELLPESLRRLHRDIILTFAKTGRPLTLSDIADRVPDVDPVAALRRLGGDDLVVLGTRGDVVLGAYPLTVEETPHRLQVNGVRVNATGALEAMAVGPLLEAEVVIESTCHVEAEPLRLRLRGPHLIEAHPNGDIRVGMRWQKPTDCAAHSMCREMVFLLDEPTGRFWKARDPERISLFRLTEAVELGHRFFKPLFA